MFKIYLMNLINQNTICNDKYNGSTTLIINKNVIYSIWYNEHENILINNLFIGLVKKS